MQDVELYRQLKEQRAEVWAGRAESARWPCPECATDLPRYDHAEERTWRHLDSC